MAQRAAGFSRKKVEVAKAVYANDLAHGCSIWRRRWLFAALSARDRAPARALQAARKIDPSCSLSCVPQARQKLSAGRNNGDGSWSLAGDELEGLVYLLPENLSKPHTLAIRIWCSFDGSAASTLKLLDFPISYETLEANPVPVEVTRRDQPDAQSVADMRRLEEELMELRTALAFRETELAESRQEIARARQEIVGGQAELATRQAAWNIELNERLSVVAAQAKSDIAQSRAARQAEQDARLEQGLSAERERWQKGEPQRRLVNDGAKALESGRIRAPRRGGSGVARTTRASFGKYDGALRGFANRPGKGTRPDRCRFRDR